MGYFKRYFWNVFHTQNHERREPLLILSKGVVTVAGDGGRHVIDILNSFGLRESTATDCYLLAVFEAYSGS